MRKSEILVNNHPAFERLVGEITGNPEIGVGLLTLLGCPPNLSYLLDGLERTLSIFSSQRALLEKTVDLNGIVGCGVAELTQYLRSILNQRDRIKAEVGERSFMPMERADENKSHPLRHYCISTCVYWSGLFYTLHPDCRASATDYAEFFDELAVHFMALMATVDTERYSRFIDDWAREGTLKDVTVPKNFFKFQSRISNAGRAARLLTLPKYWKPYVALMDVNQGEHLEDRLFSAMSLGPGHWGKDDWEILTNIALLFVLTVDHWHRPGETEESEANSYARGGGSRKAKFRDGFVRIAGTNWLREILDTDDESDITLIRPFVNDPYELPDAPADDYLGMDAIAIVEGSASTSRAVRTVTAKRQARHIARHHQQLTLAYDLMTDTERSAIVKWIKTIAMPNSVHELEYPEIPLLVSASLSLGRSIKQLHKEHLSIDHENLELPVVYLTDSKSWRIRVTGPDYAQDTYSASANELPLSTHLIVPDFGYFGELLERFGMSEVEKFKLGRLTGKMLRSIKSVLIEMSGDPRITSTMLPKPIFRLLLNGSRGDLAVASMITDRRLGHSSTTLHYATYSETHLRRLYINTARKLWFRVKTRKSVSEPSPSESPSLYFGARQTPTIETVQGLIRDLARPLIPSNITDRMAYHNAYTLYTVTVVTLSLAYRASTSPMVSNWDDISDLVIFTDKAHTDYHRRASFLPTVSETLLINYGNHRRAMAAMWPEYRRLSEKKVLVALWDASRGRFRPYRPIDFELHTPDYGLPLRSLRRFMRNTLVTTERADVESVDAWDGALASRPESV